MLQSQYVAWLEALPNSLQDSATAEALQAICEPTLRTFKPSSPRAGSAETDAFSLCLAPTGTGEAATLQGNRLNSGSSFRRG